MSLKIEKNYLGEALKHFDIDGNQIIELEEWCAFFGDNLTDARIKAKDLLKNILKGVFPNESPERFPMLAEAILMNHSDQKQGHDERVLNLEKLFDYVIRFIAPQKYREYQAQLNDKTAFFLYDGVIELDEFDIFMDDNGRMICADVYYFLVSYHIAPQIAEKMVDIIKLDKRADFKPDDFSLDAKEVFSILSHLKNGENVIDIDSILNFAERHNIDAKVAQVFHLFGIHNDLFKKIKETNRVSYEDAYFFLSYQHTHYFELGLKMLLDALNIQLRDIDDVMKLMILLGYKGKADKIFKELCLDADAFTSEDMFAFLQDNAIEAQKSNS